MYNIYAGEKYMAKEIVLNKSDLLVMNLVHYFITEKNYNPVILHGITDEIWLENMDLDYKIVRIVSHYIHNEEQLNFDRFKLNKISKNLKKKTFSLKMPVLSIYTNLSDDVVLPKEKDKLSFFIKKQSDINNDALISVFPDIVSKTNHEEKGIDLFMKISEEINTNTYKKTSRIDKIFSQKNPIITYAIMIACLLMTILMFILGDGFSNSTLIRFGANNDFLVKSGEYYRLLTCIFLHGGLVHLVLNMYSLYVIGPQIESFFGKAKFLFIYIVSGICGSLLSIAFTHNSISVGASGAIFGLLGSLLYFGYYYRAYLGNVVKSQILPIILVNLMIGFIIPNIDNGAHIGGLIGGVLATMAVGIPEKGTKFEKNNGIITLLIYVAFIAYLALFK